MKRVGRYLLVCLVIGLSGCAPSPSSSGVLPTNQTVQPAGGGAALPLTDTITQYQGHTLHCIGVNRADNGRSSTAAFSCDFIRFYKENPSLPKLTDK